MQNSFNLVNQDFAQNISKFNDFEVLKVEKATQSLYVQC